MNPYGTRFTKEDRKNRTILMPNLTPEFSKIMQVAIESIGCRAEILPLADENAVSLGKYYVHNDICFPAQLNIGEVLLALKSGRYNRDEHAMGLSKNCKACRALQYFALARKALDRAGFPDVPLITSGEDVLDIHPGFKVNFTFRIKSLQGMAFVDAINDMRQKTLPYEKNPGETQALHAKYLNEGTDALRTGFRHVKGKLRKAVEAFNAVESDRSVRKPVVGIVGEILVNYHPTANYRMAEYLLKNGMEVFLPPLLDFFRQEIMVLKESADLGFERFPILDRLNGAIMGFIYNHHTDAVDNIMKNFKYYEPRSSIQALRDYGAEVINPAFSSGEGWLLPGEIISMIKKGVKSFVIVQPFGCLPNHISGRGIIRAVKEKYPQIQILSIDFDPDVSAGNIENRLQMLIMSARERMTPAAGS